MTKNSYIRWVLGLSQIIGALAGFILLFAITLPAIPQTIAQFTTSPIRIFFFSVSLILYFILLGVTFNSGRLLLLASSKFYKPTLISLFAQIPIVSIFGFIEYEMCAGLYGRFILEFSMENSNLTTNLETNFSFLYSGLISVSSAFEGILKLGVNIMPLVWLYLLRKDQKKQIPQNSEVPLIEDKKNDL